MVPIEKSTYRPSASLILAARDDSSSTYDYNLLLIKRSERTSYMLNHCVFPGGNFDAKADESPDWLAYFHSFGVTPAQLNLLSCDQASDRPDFLTAGKHFSRDISLRLTALREAFEEVGIMLCFTQEDFKNWTSHSTHLLLKPFERLEWQQRVHNDASQFLQLCKHLNVLPDLWSLNEWSTWRTAATGSRKHDTVYYLACLNEQVNQVDLLPEPQEVISSHWFNPGQAWSSSQEGVIWLPFMLLYEMARLMNLQYVQELLEFAQQRQAKGSTLIQPIYYRSDDSMFGVLPGDDLYLKEPVKCTETIILPGSVREYNNQAKHYNRFIVYDFHRVDLAANVKPLDGHLPLQSQVNTKLAKL